MLRNYFITAVRNFVRHPIYSFINVFGLVLGLTASILILLWVWDELNYDRYHPANARTYKVMRTRQYGDGSVTTDAWTSGLLASTMKQQIPGVEKATRLSWSETKLFTYGDVTSYEPGDYADEDIFETLNLTLIEGDPLHPLPDKNSIAISMKMADKFFKGQKALGQIFRVNNKTDMVVTAVFEDLPDNVTEKFEFIAHFEVYIDVEFGGIANYTGGGWNYVFVKLDANADVASVDKQLAAFAASLEGPGSHLPHHFLFPMHEWHLYDYFENGVQSGGRITYVVSFIILAALILLIACVNFMNLSTARAANRSKEVGIRKVSGASPQLLVRQFLTESIVLSLFSLLISCVIVFALLPVFNSLVDKNLRLDITNPVVLLALLGISLLTGITAGSYPAFFLSSFRPASVLKGNLQSTFKGIELRRVLVVFQFSLSMIIIVSAFVIDDQISYMRNKNLGFDKNNVMIVRSTNEVFSHYDAFRNELMQNSAIKSVAVGDGHPMELNGVGYYDWNGKPEDDDRYFNQAHSDYDYLTTLGFRFVQGRNFSREIAADTNNFIITQSAAEEFGFENPIGERLSYNEGNVEFRGEIIGVVEDFHNLSIKEAQHPTVFTLGIVSKNMGRWANVFIKYEDGKLTEALDHVRNVHKAHSPGFPLQYDFVDADFEDQFWFEQTMMGLGFAFALLAVGISCLGLFGLASFAAARRSKEIGIRKVLGATVSGLILMLCQDYAKLMMYGILIGIPVAWLVMDRFLGDYPYHTQLSIYVFIVPALMLLVIALGIVSFQSGKAALRNPVDVLKSE